MNKQIKTKLQDLIKDLSKLEIDEAVSAINEIKIALHKASPFHTQPVDCVVWVKAENIIANDYNPNSVAPPEMELLRLSIESDGYTQPIVVFNEEERYEVVDGFHRNRVGKEFEAIKSMVHGYLPVTLINNDRQDKNDRIASTIRHNRARGKHRVDLMADIVIELKRRNWSDEKIGKELGMEPDEVLRLTQITGLAEMFADKEFSMAWEPEQINEDDDLSVEAEG